ncbi:heme-binding protein [Halovulum dunhuangense]|uniref:Heme-binding protein n=1 Tax=Halovulum dunhuangense TaxID=1505036 RepID=A0A849KVU7_9RHOB|nr:heme-binding protein [Halovulum dunhuangense]NNU79245.1 heme-binding protein [Halovulum dunhuangense]
MIRSSMLAAVLMLAAGGPALAQDDSPYVDFQMLKPEVALEMAQAALEHCRAEGFQVGVAVVDRMGVPQIFLRDRFAGAHVHETAMRKAWTAASFRTDTVTLDQNTRPETVSGGIRHISQALPLGGGVPVESAEGSIVAAIGISGAPTPEADDACARAGIEAIADLIAF